MLTAGQPFGLASAQKSERERSPLRVSSASGGGGSSFDLCQRQTRMVQKHATGSGQLDPARAAGQELGADFRLQVADLAA